MTSLQLILTSVALYWCATVGVDPENRSSRNLITQEAWTGPVNGRVSYRYDNDVHTILRQTCA